MKRVKLGSALWSFIAIIGLWPDSAVWLHGEDSPIHQWRSVRNGGINSLYCYLRANGVPCKYSDLVKGLEEGERGRPTAASLAHLTAKNGLPLQLVSLTMDELKVCSKPVIVHMDGESPEAGAFLLVLTVNPSIDYVNGPTATVQHMGREEFLRVWSGIALLPKAHNREDSVFYLLGCGIGLSIPSILQLTRR